ncbi:MAG: serine hydrolase domain-containing protein [Sphingomonas sp.]
MRRQTCIGSVHLYIPASFWEDGKDATSHVVRSDVAHWNNPIRSRPRRADFARGRCLTQNTRPRCAGDKCGGHEGRRGRLSWRVRLGLSRKRHPGHTGFQIRNRIGRQDVHGSGGRAADPGGQDSRDDDIRKYLPGMPAYAAPITIAQLLRHTSGLRDYSELLAMRGIRFEDSVTQDEIVRLIEAQREINFLPGTDYSYTNSEYILLSRIVEKVTANPLPIISAIRSFARWAWMARALSRTGQR